MRQPTRQDGMVYGDESSRKIEGDKNVGVPKIHCLKRIINDLEEHHLH